jgi:RimJ/RimL family protein N-acetyltransferase
MEIKGQGFSLRGWRADDAAALQKHADNIHVSSYLFDRFPYPYTMDNAVEWINHVMKQEPLLNLVIDVDGGLAGVIGIDMRTDVYQKAPLIGYWLGEAYWGKGIMPKALKLFVNYAFTTFDIVRLQAGVFNNNPRSMRVLEKAGFEKEGILKSSIIKNGVILDEHVYGLTGIKGNRD